MSAEQDLANANVQIANLISEVTRFRDAAMGINNIWPTITEGRQNTVDGKYFSVPGDGAYLKLYRRAGTSQTLIAEFPDRAELNSVIAQLGPLLGRGVVGGSGDLMAKNAFGIGASTRRGIHEVADANNLPNENGIYSYVDVNTLGAPSSNRASVLVTAWENLTGFLSRSEFAIENSTGQTTPNCFIRGFRESNDPEFTKWSMLYGQTNLVGNVSQSGGVPTGAVFAKDSNSFGDWWMCADGRMKCRAKVRFEYLNSPLFIRYVWTFPCPVPFVSSVSPFVTVLESQDSASIAGSNRGSVVDPLAAVVRRSGTVDSEIRLVRRTDSPEFVTGDSATAVIEVEGRWY